MRKIIESIANFFTEVLLRFFVRKKNPFTNPEGPVEKYRIQHILNGESSKEFYANSKFKIEN
jgi:hypothetical protein